MDIFSEGFILISVGVVVVFAFLITMALFTKLVLRFDPDVKAAIKSAGTSGPMAGDTAKLTTGAVSPTVAAVIALALQRHHQCGVGVAVPAAQGRGQGSAWGRSGRLDIIHERQRAQVRAGAVGSR